MNNKQILLYTLLFIVCSPGIFTRVKRINIHTILKYTVIFFVFYIFINYVLFYNRILNEYFNDDDKFLRVQKSDGKLIFNEGSIFPSRNKSTIWQITEADKIYNWPDFPQFIIHIHDIGVKSVFSYSQENSYENVIPDFTFHNWQEVRIEDYIETVNEIDKYGRLPFEVNKVGWMGVLETNPMRKTLFDIGQAHTDILDIINMNWKENQEPTRYMSLPELVSKYSTLIDIEGVGWSGRLKFLLWSHRPLIIVDRPHKEYYFEHLKEWEHYIPVKRDLSDLIEKTNWIMNNYDKAQKIAENAYEFAKIHLTREACYAQWDKMIRNITKNN